MIANNGNYDQNDDESSPKKDVILPSTDLIANKPSEDIINIKSKPLSSARYSRKLFLLCFIGYEQVNCCLMMMLFKNLL